MVDKSMIEQTMLSRRSWLSTASRSSFMSIACRPGSSGFRSCWWSATVHRRGLGVSRGGRSQALRIPAPSLIIGRRCFVVRGLRGGEVASPTEDWKIEVDSTLTLDIVGVYSCTQVGLTCPPELRSEANAIRRKRNVSWRWKWMRGLFGVGETLFDKYAHDDDRSVSVQAPAWRSIIGCMAIYHTATQLATLFLLFLLRVNNSNFTKFPPH
eukprot:767616-Hanusia_phi.AAC.3